MFTVLLVTVLLVTGKYYCLMTAYSTYQHFIINLYIALGQPEGGGSLYPLSTSSRLYNTEIREIYST